MSTFEIDNHSRIIIHIDVDCFYAQVEMNKNPSYRTVPLGVSQKNLIVTSNYTAREFGIKKCMYINEAKKLCPSLVLVNGEDLHDYRQISYKITNLLQKFTPLVERLGLDENFMDVTALVNEKLKTNKELTIIGNVFGDCSNKCDCGCTQRLIIGTRLAQEVRDLIKTELNLTTCAGVAHNKLVAKIVGSRHKPNQQTLIFPNSVLELMLSLKSLTSIPGIGRAMFDQLLNEGIESVEDLQNLEIEKLESILGDKAQNVYNLSFGIDPSPVKPSGKPQSIGLEDSCKSISIEAEVRRKLEQLLTRLLLLVSEDGRVPKTIKLTVRKFEKDSKMSHRETRQCNINPSIFTSNQPNKEARIMTTIMHLFNRIIDVKKPYHITLLGLSFTKFQEAAGKNSIASFLRKDLEVQSVISIENEKEVEETNLVQPSTSGTLIEESPTPSPKKLKLGNLITKKRGFFDFDDCESPSKLKVADLCLESISCPPDADKEVFKELPIEVQKELWEDYKRRKSSEMNCGSQVKKSKPNTLLNYFIRNK